MENVDETIKKYILINAIEHNGVAQTKSVLGKLLADEPSLRKNILSVKNKIEDGIDEINRLGLGKQKEELEKMGGYKEVKKIEKKVLPDLDVGRSFVIRFAPNPNGAIHLGNARPAILCDEYRKKYKGKLILRFDDTDPKIKVPEKQFYKWIKEDLKWLKVKWDTEIVASKRLNIYYTHAESLIKDGNAYVCSCEVERWRNLRDKSKSCPCRKSISKKNMMLWKKMLTGKLKEGSAVLRIKTDLEAKNPAVRDWPAFRIVDKPKHPFSKKKLWPLYNFASAIDDHLLGVTHIFRGQEHTTNEVKQRYLYQHFKWKYPFNIVLGRFSLVDMVLSKTAIREGIKETKYRGWDDLTLGTIRSLKRRGFQPEAIRRIIVDVGVKPSDITISFENLAGYNKKIIDSKANRYFFVANPIRIEMDKMPIKKIDIPIHPENKTKKRTIQLDKIFYIDKDDFNKYKGIEVRLKDLCNIKLGEKSKYTGKEIKSIPKIHWVPKDNISVRVFLPNKRINGFGEANLAKTKIGDVIQFERFGFVRIEKAAKTNIVAIFCHE
ncbi:glutamate--tRNA ligase [Candidatus Aenigmatarchaeota archaeon]